MPLSGASHCKCPILQFLSNLTVHCFGAHPLPISIDYGQALGETLYQTVTQVSFGQLTQPGAISFAGSIALPSSSLKKQK